MEIDMQAPGRRRSWGILLFAGVLPLAPRTLEDAACLLPCIHNSNCCWFTSMLQPHGHGRAS